MTIADALTVQEGSFVTSKFSTSPNTPRKVLRVWQNDARTIVRFRISGLGSGWIDSGGLEKAKAIA